MEPEVNQQVPEIVPTEPVVITGASLPPKRRFRWLWIILVLLIIVGAGYYIVNKTKKIGNNSQVDQGKPGVAKPASFYYVTTVLPTYKLPTEVPSGIVVDKKADIERVTEMTAADKPTIYTIIYTTNMHNIDLDKAYFAFYSANHMMQFNGPDGKMLYTSADQGKTRMKMDYVYDQNAGNNKVTVQYVIYQ